MEVMTIAIQHHELVVGAIAVLILYIAGKYVGSYIDQYVSWRFKQRHGICECPVSLQFPSVVEQQKYHDQCIEAIKTTLATHTTILNRLSENNDKLFELFEEEWKERIKTLQAKGSAI